MSRPKQHPIYLPENPALLENVAIELRTKLLSHFTWLGNAYLIAQRHVKQMDGRDVRFPAVQVRGTEYISVLPDAHLGNHTYLDSGGTDTIDYHRARSRIETEVGLVFFFNYRDVYPTDWQSSTIERVKSDVLDFFAATSFQSAKMRPLRFHTDPAGIYSDYDYWEIKQQFLMKPYGALRIDLSVFYFQNCP